MHGLHFVGAQDLSAVVYHGEYNVGLVVASLILVMVATYTGFSQLEIIRQQKTLLAQRLWFFVGALTLGIGVWSMHFVGMLAHQMPIEIFYDIPTTLLSFMPAAAAGYIALHFVAQNDPQGWKIVFAGVLMGAGIGTMHYVGMSAMHSSAHMMYDIIPFLLSILFAVILACLALSVPYWLSSVLRSIAWQRVAAAVLMGLAVSGMHYIAMGAVVFVPSEHMLIPAGALGEATIGQIAIYVSSLLIVIAALSALVIERMNAIRFRLEDTEQQMHKLEHYDELTGLPNRKLLSTMLENELADHAQVKQWQVLVVLEFPELDNMVAVIGQQQTDCLRVEIAQVLREYTGVGNVVARTGDTQFTLVYTAQGYDETLARRLIDHRLSFLRERLLKIKPLTGVNIGLVLIQNDGRSDALSKSMVALTLSRKAQGNIAYFHHDAQEQLRSRWAKEDELRRALINDEFILYLQPQFDQSGKQCIGAEALVRWRHPVRGLVGPVEFIPLAEELGLIVDLGNSVLEKACQILQRWQQNAVTQHYVLSVNVSAEQFRRDDFIERILSVLERYQLPSRCLKLEITESMAMENLRQAIDTINTLKERGIRFSMDDFGTGYSSLSYFARLPFDEVKIDKSFVQTEMNEQGLRDWMIIEGIILMARRLGMNVVAEGVETAEQHQRLRENGCPVMQGYLFGKPMSVADFERLHGG